MNNPPVENEARTMAGSSETGGHPSATEAGVQARPAAAGQEALVGPFGLRDTVVLGSVLVMLVGSILPFFTVTRLGFETDFNLWNAFSLFFIGIGILLPLLVAGLFAGRRLAPGMKPRVGSLSLDQFASVTAVLALAFFFIQTVTDFSVGAMVALIGSLGLVVSTALAPHLPFFAREFKDRPEAPAALTARAAQPLRPRPARPKPEAKPESDKENTVSRRFTNPMRRNQDDARATVNDAPGQSGTAASVPGGTAVVAAPAAGASAAEPATQAQAAAASPATQVAPTTPAAPASSDHPAAASPAASASPAAGMQAEEPMAATTVNPVVRDSGARTPETAAAGVSEQETSSEPITATRDESEAVVEAFWFAVGTPRQIVDERTGLPLFMFHPGDWELGLEDRGDEFLVQDKRTGRIGVLRDLSNIERVDADQ